MGIVFLLTSALSVGAIIQRNHVLIGLIILNWALIADAIIVLVVGTYVWFYTLREGAEFHAVWTRLQPSQRISIQDQASPSLLHLSCLSNQSGNGNQFSCCGYFNASDNLEIGGNFCQNSTFANSLNTTVTSNFCVTPITHFVDVSLNQVFSYVQMFLSIPEIMTGSVIRTSYGFMAAIIGLFLSSLCVIKVVRASPYLSLFRVFIILAETRDRTVQEDRREARRKGICLMHETNRIPLLSLCLMQCIVRTCSIGNIHSTPALLETQHVS
jgi:hypothetical protein